jgi:hypothetical protein
MPHSLTISCVTIDATGGFSAIATVQAHHDIFWIHGWRRIQSFDDAMLPQPMAEAIAFFEYNVGTPSTALVPLVDITQCGMPILGAMKRPDLKPMLVSMNPTLTYEESRSGVLGVTARELVNTVRILSQTNRLRVEPRYLSDEDIDIERQRFCRLEARADGSAPDLDGANPRMKALAIACWYGEYLDRREKMQPGARR